MIQKLSIEHLPDVEELLATIWSSFVFKHWIILHGLIVIVCKDGFPLAHSISYTSKESGKMKITFWHKGITYTVEMNKLTLPEQKHYIFLVTSMDRKEDGKDPEVRTISEIPGEVIYLDLV